MLVMKCSRLLRLGSRPSLKLLKAVIGICSPFVCQLRWLPQSGIGLFLLGSCGRGCRKIGVPNIGYDLPCSVRLFFEDLDVLAVVLHRSTAGVSHRFFVVAARVGEIDGFR